MIGADINGYNMLGKGTEVDKDVMGRFGRQERNAEEQMLVDFAKQKEMAIVNTCFQKR